MEKIFKALHLFGGIGGAALGFQQASAQFKGITGKFRTLAGIDSDPAACSDFKSLTGAEGVEMDLFDRSGYTAYHGKEPPADWREVIPEELTFVCNGEYPDVVFLSPPCKGFSALLSGKNAESEKYKALNRLVLRGLRLTLSAFRSNLPVLILLENVPRITTRGKQLLKDVKGLLSDHGYVFHEGYHNCGEMGGLAQRRRRYLLVARNKVKLPCFVYKPPAIPLKTIGEVIGTMALPDAPCSGPMHRLPRLQWKTWVRLALIPAGGDWRDLEKISPEEYRLEYNPRGGGSYGVQKWDKPGGTIIGNSKVNGSNAVCIADPRLGCKVRNGTYGINAWDKPGVTVTGSADIHQGCAAVADPRSPTDNNRQYPLPVITALDGTWHRPLTTLELASLQGFPVMFPDGRPLVLAGKSDSKWRERIGNAVPPPTAKAIAEQILMALLASYRNEWFLGSTGIWVAPYPKERRGKLINTYATAQTAHS